jgi:exopolysaccharide biosynthesis polyprenyl glycosylphosphotransferase
MKKNNFHFSISERKLLLRILDLVFVIEGLAIISFLFDFHYFTFESKNIVTWMITLCVYVLGFGQIFESYDLKVAKDKYLTLRSVLLTGLLATVFYVFTPVIAPALPENRMQILYLFLAITISIYVWRIIYMYFIFSPLFYKRILLIGGADTVSDIEGVINNYGQDNLIVGYLNKEKLSTELKYFDTTTNLIDLVKKNLISEVVVESFEDELYSQSLTPQLINLFEEGFPITSTDNFKERITNRIPETRLNNSFYNHIKFSRSHQNRLYLLAHRIFDILSSITGIAFFIAILPLIVILNLIGNRGKLFYLQKRVGKGGRLFNIIKLRTMVADAEKDGAVWAIKNDRRITKFGKFLRRTRLDEVPQFFNVLKGDMSLIGPRPERPEFVEELKKDFPFFTARHVIKPGLTGWAQVEYPYAGTKEEQLTKLRYDLYYIKERNLLLDFKIVIKTISTVLFYRGH